MGEVYVEMNSLVSTPDYQAESNPIEAWLPITQSRKGNAYTSSFHLVSSGIGLQALSLPVAFAALGWVWGILSLSLAFAWQLYTAWLLVHLHEPIPGTRYSRYVRLSIAAFGEKLGKLLAIFPVSYLSGGTCVLLIINGGKTMELFYQAMCENGPPICNPKAFTGAECFLVFTCLAIIVALFCPSLNSVSGVSFLGAIAAVGYCTLFWVVFASKARPNGASYVSSMAKSSETERFCGILNALGILAIAFRGHNLVLEIEGTLPSNPKHPPCEQMWKAVKVSYLIISLCLFPLAIGGYWACGNKIPASSGFLSALSVLNGRTSKFVKGFIYLLITISCLCSFQTYAMPFLDNLEFIYASKKNKQCPRWVRFGFRFFFGGLTFFIAVALPFLGSLAALLGGLTLPLTFAYPCFMWIAIMKPRQSSVLWWSNLCLGCLGILLSVLLVVAAVWNLVVNGLDANFFNPH